MSTVTATTTTTVKKVSGTKRIFDHANVVLGEYTTTGAASPAIPAVPAAALKEAMMRAMDSDENSYPYAPSKQFNRISSKAFTAIKAGNKFEDGKTVKQAADEKTPDCEFSADEVSAIKDAVDAVVTAYSESQVANTVSAHTSWARSICKAFKDGNHDDAPVFDKSKVSVEYARQRVAKRFQKGFSCVSKNYPKTYAENKVFNQFAQAFKDFNVPASMGYCSLYSDLGVLSALNATCPTARAAFAWRFPVKNLPITVGTSANLALWTLIHGILSDLAEINKVYSEDTISSVRETLKQKDNESTGENSADLLAITVMVANAFILNTDGGDFPSPSDVTQNMVPPTEETLARDLADPEDVEEIMAVDMFDEGKDQIPYFRVPERNYCSVLVTIVASFYQNGNNFPLVHTDSEIAQFAKDCVGVKDAAGKFFITHSKLRDYGIFVITRLLCMATKDMTSKCEANARIAGTNCSYTVTDVYRMFMSRSELIQKFMRDVTSCGSLNLCSEAFFSMIADCKTFKDVEEEDSEEEDAEDAEDAEDNENNEDAEDEDEDDNGRV